MKGMRMNLEKGTLIKLKRKGYLQITRGDVWISSTGGEDIILSQGQQWQWNGKKCLLQGMGGDCSLIIFSR